jgi:hypothetical protein
MTKERESESGRLGTMRSFEEYRARVFPNGLIVVGLIRTAATSPAPPGPTPEAGRRW